VSPGGAGEFPEGSGFQACAGVSDGAIPGRRRPVSVRFHTGPPGRPEDAAPANCSRGDDGSAMPAEVTRCRPDEGVSR